jgi:hypothetical protein
MVPTVFVVGALGAGVASGAVPVTFDVSGGQFNLSAASLHGTDFTQYGSSVTVKAGGAVKPVAESTIGGADITNLCQSVAQPFGPTVVWLQLTAGDNGTPAHADSLVIDMSQLSGDATFTRIDIGQDASDLSSRGQLGGFGQSADVVDITGLHQTAWATTAGTFKLPHLNLGLQLGGNDPCPTPAA